MYVAIYEFEVKPGCAQDFERSWAAVTDAICEHRGSLGSRLHRSADRPNVYVAYAQWPSADVYHDETGMGQFTAEQQMARQRMRDSLMRSETLHLVEVCDDRLVAGDSPRKTTR